MSDIKPYDEKQLVELISKRYHANDIQSALSLCEQLNKRFDQYHHGWYLAGFLLSKVNSYKDALLAIDKALYLHTSDKYLLLKAQCYLSLGRIEQAKEACASLRSAVFSNAGLHHELGELFNNLTMYPEALGQFEKAIALDSSHYQFHFNRATVQRYLGDNEAARQSYDKAIALNPRDYESYSSRSSLQKQSRTDNHIEELKRVASSAEESDSKAKSLPHIYYALAKEQEDVGNYSESFSALSLASDKKRRQIQYNIQTDIGIMEAITNSYTAARMDTIPKGLDGNDAIFIIGMPRTGTTLVERILASHTAVFAAGELNNFAMEMMQQVRESGIKPQSRLDLIEATTMLNFGKLGDAYLKGVHPLRDKSSYFIDKLPFNYLYAGLIHLAMPNAKIINLQRHPMATCYAVYKQLFKEAYPFSYQLEELARYYVAYHQLMQHWNTVMPGVIHTLAYEDVVSDTEKEAKALLLYCGLEWQPQCLQFHKNKQASTTASASQVRQPVYKSSVDLWRQYRDQLQPLEAILNDAGINTD